MSGSTCESEGDGAECYGEGANATGGFTTAIGANATAATGDQDTDFGATALGYSANASGFNSTAIGRQKPVGSTFWLFSQCINRDWCTAIGNNTAPIQGSTALGKTKASKARTNLPLMLDSSQQRNAIVNWAVFKINQLSMPQPLAPMSQSQANTEGIAIGGRSQCRRRELNSCWHLGCSSQWQRPAPWHQSQCHHWCTIAFGAGATRIGNCSWQASGTGDNSIVIGSKQKPPLQRAIGIEAVSNQINTTGGWNLSGKATGNNSKPLMAIGQCQWWRLDGLWCRQPGDWSWLYCLMAFFNGGCNQCRCLWYRSRNWRKMPQPLATAP